MELGKKCDMIKKEINRLSGQYSSSDIFRDIIDLIVILIGASTSANIGETGEDIYNRLTGRYSDNVLREMVKIANEICDTISDTKKDVLGRLYMSLRPNKANGQFFTPDSVSEVMAELSNVAENNSISDPCCGSGSLILGAIRTIEKSGRSYRKPVFYLNDIDMLCCKMVFIQMSVVGATAYITCSNALTNPPFRSDYDGYWLKTPMYFNRENIAPTDEPNQKAS